MSIPEHSLIRFRLSSTAAALALSALTGCGSSADGPPAPMGAGGFDGAGGYAAGGYATTGAVPGSGSGQGSGGSGGPGQSQYVNMAPPMLSALPRGAAGQWQYQEIDGAQCRDGSKAGFYVRFSDTSKKLVIYLEQGGACFNSALCAYNPVNVDDSITGRTLSETISGMRPGVRQAPPTTGIWSTTDPAAPYVDWNAVWVPYCTGDAFGGSNPNATVPGVQGVQQFVGYQNMQKFVGHIVPTFQDAERVVLTGSSAGSFGAGLNYNQVQDAFGSVPVTLIMDSGIPFSDAYMSPCLQQTWRDLWKVDEALPPDCTECRQADGGGLTNLVLFSAKKYPNARLAIISATEDDVMRFFMGFGENNCTGTGSYTGAKYTEAINDLRTMAAPYRSQFASYYVPGIKHMYLQFDDFYQPLTGGVTVASWMNDVLAGNLHDVGP